MSPFKSNYIWATLLIYSCSIKFQWQSYTGTAEAIEANLRR